MKDTLISHRLASPVSRQVAQPLIPWLMANEMLVPDWIDPGIGARLKACRNTAGMTQEAVAAEVGVTKAQIGHYERGYSLPSVKVLVALCLLYRVSADSILFANAREQLDDAGAKIMSIIAGMSPDQRRGILTGLQMAYGPAVTDQQVEARMPITKSLKSKG